MTTIIGLARSLSYCLICLALLLSFASGLSLASSAPATDWEKNYGEASSKESGASVWQTSDDGFIITGGNDKSQLMLIKTDWQGNVMWIKNDADGDAGKFVRQTSDGGYVVVGSNGGNLFVLKTDENGNKVWSKTYPRPNGKAVTGEAIQQTPDGGYIVAGSINKGGKEGSDMYVVKLAANGDQQWDKSYGGVDGEVGTGADYGHTVWPTGDGGYVIGGSDWSSTYWPKAAMVKLDANGNQQWYKIYDEANDRSDGSSVEVQQTRDGGYIYAGQRNSKMFLLKTDPNGNQQWNRLYESGQFYSVQQTWDDGYVMTGYAGANYENVVVIRTDSSGNQLWEKKMKGLGLAGGVSVQQIGNGSYVVAGSTKVDKDKKDDFYLAQLDKDFTPVPNAKLVSDSMPHIMEAGKAYSVQVTFENTGTMPWTFQDETTFGHHEDAAKFGVTGANQTIQIGKVVRPGQSETFSFTMTAPGENGTYNPRFRMMWEGHNPFGTLDNKTIWVVNGTGPAVSPPATAPSSAIEIGAATPQATAPTATTAQATENPAATSSTGFKLPCLSSVLLPLLIVGTVGIGLYQRRKKDN